MQLTKFGHSCVRLTDGDRTLVVDPGVFSDVDAALDRADGVLITHEHPDHVDVDAVRRFGGPVWAPASVAGQVGGTAVGAGDGFDAAGFAVEAFGGQHAVIHPSIPYVANLGYLIEGRLYHPGDAFAVPTRPVETLLVPIHAPWSKVGEVLDFVIAVRAGQAHQIHDGLLNQTGLDMVEGHVRRVGGQYGTAFGHLSVGETVAV
jgi:L-ascorbate metabolism protein UlaG (beta-lactamase superfamily)